MIKKRITYIISILILAFSLPVSAWAEGSGDPSSGGSTDSSNTTTPATPPSAPAPAASPAAVPAPAPSPGPASPTGDDASTYTYNASTGLWENDYYTWNPTTHQTSPKTSQDYSYNPATGKWDTTQYVYDAPSAKYVPNVVSSATNPQAANGTSLAPSDANPALSNTGPNSTNTTNTTSNNGVFNLFYNGAISNAITLNAASGDAAVANNTYGGSALTGNALDVNNIINMLSSSFGLQDAANLLTFTKNIDGNVVGDITIDPSLLGPSSLNVGNSNTQNNLTINARENGAINNDINLGAKSGDATVANNTHAGDATSGNADAVANVVNVLNSAIASNKSFLGVININGNLDGDILLPPNFLDQLIASNAPHATVNLSKSLNNNVTLNASNNNSIANNVNLAAATGAADVSNNTSAGSASSGNANTNLTVFNLTGKQVIAKDSILVFVNVLGQWVGLIMDAPNGSTAAALAGNVSQNNNVSNNVNANLASNSAINNNVNINSKSGDATVADNTNAGNAKSGNATSSANIANIIDSQLSASDWFGMLFINVLGFWHGSFGVNTDAGTIFNNPVATGAAGSSGNNLSAPAAIFRFIPKNNHTTVSSALADLSRSGGSESANNPPANAILANARDNRSSGSGAGANAAPSGNQSVHASKQNLWVIPAASFAVIMITTSAFGGSGEFTNKLHAKLLSRKINRA
jgi:hypothetical protein